MAYDDAGPPCDDVLFLEVESDDAVVPVEVPKRAVATDGREQFAEQDRFRIVDTKHDVIVRQWAHNVRAWSLRFYWYGDCDIHERLRPRVVLLVASLARVGLHGSFVSGKGWMQHLGIERVTGWIKKKKTVDGLKMKLFVMICHAYRKYCSVLQFLMATYTIFLPVGRFTISAVENCTRAHSWHGATSRGEKRHLDFWKRHSVMFYCMFRVGVRRGGWYSNARDDMLEVINSGQFLIARTGLPAGTRSDGRMCWKRWREEKVVQSGKPNIMFDPDISWHAR